MTVFEFAIDLTVPDNTAFTVLTALRAMGYVEVSRVERSDLLRLGLRDGAMTAEECGRALTHAEIVFNPNKHRLAIAGSGVADGFEAVVEDLQQDNGALLELLAERFGIQGLERVDRATAWRLVEGDMPASRERLEWASRALLANEFSQRLEIRARAPFVTVD